MFAISWIYWKIELLQNVDMKRNNKFYWYVKSSHLTIYWQVFALYFNPTIIDSPASTFEGLRYREIHMVNTYN